MNKNLLFLILGTVTVILSVVIISVGPVTNKVLNTNWGNQNCELLSDQIKLLKDEVTKLKKMKSLCYRQKAMHDLEYTSFIINIVLGFVCADLALIHYLGFGKEFEIKTGIIGVISGVIGFVFALVYVCYSGYIFTNDVAGMELGIGNGVNTFTFGGTPIQKLYSNGALYKWEKHENDANYANGGIYVTEYENDRSDDSNYIRYKDLGKKQYNYNNKYYKSYKKYNNDQEEEENKCKYDAHEALLISNNKLLKLDDCEYLYSVPKENSDNKNLYDRWLTALILACFVILCDLGLAFFGLMLCTNFGINTNI